MLIVGADSIIGNALITYLQRAGEHVVGTTRRPEKIDEDHVYLDLSKDNLEKWQCPTSISVAVILAGVTKLEDCRRDSRSSKRVNVEGVSALIKNLVSKGIFVVYLSTNQIFDGSKPYCLPNEPVSPMTEYGRQKAETEQQISQWGDSVAIVRLTKILSSQITLFAAWSEALKSSKTIHPFSDMVMAPVPQSSVLSILKLITDMRLPGITQVSGNRDISYAEAAKLGAECIGASGQLVQPVLASQTNIELEHIPNYTTMDTNRLKLTLGIEPPDITWTIEEAFNNPQSLTGIA